LVAGRLSRNVIMSGNVFLNGKKRRLDYGGVVSISVYIVKYGTKLVKEK